MPEIVLPSSMARLLAAFESCCHAPTYRSFQVVLARRPYTARMRTCPARCGTEGDGHDRVCLVGR